MPNDVSAAAKGYDLNSGGQMMEHARALLSHLEGGDAMEALNIIHELNKLRDYSLYMEVGKLTRSLHESLVNFHIQTGGSEDDVQLSRMQDASDRLGYVISMTERAANKTMDMIEETVPLVSGLGSQAETLRTQWKKAQKKELNPEEFRNFYNEMGVFLSFACSESHVIQRRLSDILLAQDYQDLTGQVIKKVITLVQEVEDSLVSLVRMAAQVDAMSRTQPAPVTLAPVEEDHTGPEGPIIHPERRPDAVKSQDEVDDLLSSLGF